jgi:transcriptional regulator with XRE-family HTH domain
MIMQNSAMKSIGEAIRAERESQGLRQDELAAAAGISWRSVHAIEHGKDTIRFDILARAADGLGMEIVAQRRRGNAFRQP